MIPAALGQLQVVSIMYRTCLFTVGGLLLRLTRSTGRTRRLHIHAFLRVGELHKQIVEHFCTVLDCQILGAELAVTLQFSLD
jgi:hypothetical protein